MIGEQTTPQPHSQPDPQPPAPGPSSLPEAGPAAPALDNRDAGWQQAVRNVWQVAASPWLLFGLSVILAVLLGLTIVVPQLPGGLSSEAGAAQRWLTNVSAAWGGPGRLLALLGFFHVLQSPMLQVLLVLIFFTTLVHCAQQILAALALQHVPDVLDANGVNGEPLPVPPTGPILRWRHAQATPPLALASELQRLLEARLRTIERRTVRVAPAPVTLDADQAHAPENPSSITLEERLLAVRGLRAALLRPLLPLAILTAAALLWANMAFGWEFGPQPLAPGDRTADAVHNLRVEYRVDQPSPTMLNPTLIVNVDGTTAGIPIGQDVQRQINGVDVHAVPGAPALLVRTVNGVAHLARPGQANPVPSIGLDFPSEGSEESLVLPNLGVGLRIVRNEQGPPGPTGDTFLIEVFAPESEQAVKRITVANSDIITVPTINGDLPLAVVPLPSMQVSLRYSPGRWLLWLALGFLALGALGIWRRPGFVLAQVGPWPEERAVVTIQSDLPDEVTTLRKWYTEQQTGPDPQNVTNRA